MWQGGGHNIQSAISENPMVHESFMALCFIEPELLQTVALRQTFDIAGIGILDHFCSCEPDWDTIAFIYELTCIPWRYTGCAKMNSYYRDTDKHLPSKLYITQLCKWSIICISGWKKGIFHMNDSSQQIFHIAISAQYLMSEKCSDANARTWKPSDDC